MDHFVQPGETIGCARLTAGCGGKGLNQSVALARAGVETWHAGFLGAEGGFLREKLDAAGVRTDLIRTGEGSTGHAIIQVDRNGQNCIILYGGTNRQFTEAYVDETLSRFGPGDVVLLQNETNCVPYIMIKDNKCDVIWGVAGNAGNGAAEAALESGKAWFIGVDSDQELTLSSDLAAITLTSGLKNIGNSLIWFFDQWDAGKDSELFGKTILLGIAEGGVGIVTDKNYDKYASDATKKAVEAAQQSILDGKVTVPTAIGDDSGAVETLRESVRP